MSQGSNGGFTDRRGGLALSQGTGTGGMEGSLSGSEQSVPGLVGGSGPARQRGQGEQTVGGWAGQEGINQVSWGL